MYGSCEGCDSRGECVSERIDLAMASCCHPIELSCQNDLYLVCFDFAANAACVKFEDDVMRVVSQ